MLLGIGLTAATGAAGQPAAVDSVKVRLWSIGLAGMLCQPSSNVPDQLVAEMDRQGWGDDTVDEIIYGLLVPGRPYPYEDGPSPTGVRLWLARAFGDKFSLRGEVALTTTIAVHGHSNTKGYVDLRLETYSFALLPVYGRRLRLFAGPSADFVTTKNTLGEGTATIAPGLTAGAELNVYRWRYGANELVVGLGGGWHLVQSVEPGGVFALTGLSVFHPGTVDLSYGWLGVSLVATFTPW